MKQKALLATKNILYNNLDILKEPYVNNKVVLVYDEYHELSKILSGAYIENLENTIKENLEIINFDKIDKNILKNKLLSLKKNSTVILVQSTNFRIEDFRIRVSLHKNNVGCLEHNHLSYLKNSEIENYIDSIEYKTQYYNNLSNKLKKISDNAKTLKVVCKNGNILEIDGGFEDMKQNTGDYSGKNRGGTFPIGENFTESKDFFKVNGKLEIRAYPGTDMMMNFCEPFIIEIFESKIISCSEGTPKKFVEILKMIKKSEDNEIYIRELGFGLNDSISWKKTLSDVNFFERKSGFHISIGKKHGIYRKKFHRKITQRYHIDLFPNVDYMEFDGNIFLEFKVNQAFIPCNLNSCS